MGLDGSSNANALPPFLTKTYDMVDDPATDAIVSWSSDNASFVVWNQADFAKDLLPQYFKHNNFSSFVRQLNTYGFRKIDPDRWEFANEGFSKGNKDSLKSIHRRKPSASHGSHTQQRGAQELQLQPASSSSLEILDTQKLALEEEIERLHQDKSVLMMQLLNLRRQQQATEVELQHIGERLHAMEERQHQMMEFLARAMQNPGFLAQFVHQTQGSICSAGVSKKRRLPNQESSEEFGADDGQIIQYQPDCDEMSGAQLNNSEDFGKNGLSSISFEGYLRELTLSSVNSSEGSSAVTRKAGLTLTEMHSSVGFPAGPSHDVSCQSAVDVTESRQAIGTCRDSENINVRNDVGVTVYPSSQTEPERAKSTSLIPDINVCVNDEPQPLASHSSHGKTSKITANRPTTVTKSNDGFWEKYLTESPQSTETESELETDDPDDGASPCD